MKFASTRRWSALLAVVLTALVLRPAATAIGPLLPELKTDLGLTNTEAGILTALPGFVFALAGIIANAIAPRLGRIPSLTIATLLICCGSALRAITGSWTVFALFTVIALSGMAIGNVVLPSFIKATFPHTADKIATVYTTFLACGTFLPTLLASPLKQLGAQTIGEVKAWRVPVGFWALMAFLALLVWVQIANNERNTPTRAFSVSPPSIRVAKSPTAIYLMLFFGTQSMHAYIQFGWAAQAYRDGGLSQDHAALMVTIIALGGIPGGLIMPRIVSSGRYLKPTIILFSLLLAVGYLGIAWSPQQLSWLWALSLAIAGFCFPTALALIIERTRDSHITSAVSGFVQPVGYLLAAAGPLLVGSYLQANGDWQSLLYVLAATSIVLCWSGLKASRPGFVDDQIIGNP